MRLLIGGLFIILQTFVLAVDGNIVQCVALAASWFKVCLVRREQLSHWTTWSVCMCQFYVIVSLDDVDILLIHRKNGSSLVWVGAVGPRLLSFYNVYVCVYLSVQVGAFALETKKLVTVSWCQRRRFEGKLGCKSGPLPPPHPLSSPLLTIFYMFWRGELPSSHSFLSSPALSLFLGTERKAKELGAWLLRCFLCGFSWF